MFKRGAVLASLALLAGALAVGGPHAAEASAVVENTSVPAGTNLLVNARGVAGDSAYSSAPPPTRP